jgi:hypothetical protein
MNPKFRSQHDKTDMQLPQWLCRFSVGNEIVRIKIKNIIEVVRGLRNNTAE